MEYLQEEDLDLFFKNAKEKINNIKLKDHQINKKVPHYRLREDLQLILYIYENSNKFKDDFNPSTLIKEICEKKLIMKTYESMMKRYELLKERLNKSNLNLIDKFIENKGIHCLMAFNQNGNAFLTKHMKVATKPPEEITFEKNQVFDDIYEGMLFLKNIDEKNIKEIRAIFENLKKLLELYQISQNEFRKNGSNHKIYQKLCLLNFFYENNDKIIGKRCDEIFKEVQRGAIFFKTKIEHIYKLYLEYFKNIDLESIFQINEHLKEFGIKGILFFDNKNQLKIAPYSMQMEENSIKVQEEKNLIMKLNEAKLNYSKECKSIIEEIQIKLQNLPKIEVPLRPCFVLTEDIKLLIYINERYMNQKETNLFKLINEIFIIKLFDKSFMTVARRFINWINCITTFNLKKIKDHIEENGYVGQIKISSKINKIVISRFLKKSDKDLNCDENETNSEDEMISVKKSEFININQEITKNVEIKEENLINNIKKEKIEIIEIKDDEIIEIKEESNNKRITNKIEFENINKINKKQSISKENELSYYFNLLVEELNNFYYKQRIVHYFTIPDDLKLYIFFYENGFRNKDSPINIENIANDFVQHKIIISSVEIVLKRFNNLTKYINSQSLRLIYEHSINFKFKGYLSLDKNKNVVIAPSQYYFKSDRNCDDEEKQFIVTEKMEKEFIFQNKDSKEINDIIFFFKSMIKKHKSDYEQLNYPIFTLYDDIKLLVNIKSKMKFYSGLSLQKILDIMPNYAFYLKKKKPQITIRIYDYYFKLDILILKNICDFFKTNDFYGELFINEGKIEIRKFSNQILLRGENINELNIQKRQYYDEYLLNSQKYNIIKKEEFNLLKIENNNKIDILKSNPKMSELYDIIEIMASKYRKTKSEIVDILESLSGIISDLYLVLETNNNELRWTKQEDKLLTETYLDDDNFEEFENLKKQKGMKRIEERMEYLNKKD